MFWFCFLIIVAIRNHHKINNIYKVIIVLCNSHWNHDKEIQINPLTTTGQVA